MPNQSRWPQSRRLAYAEMIRQRRPWEWGGVKSAHGKQAVKYNKIQDGKQSAPILAIKRLLYQTNKLLKAALNKRNKKSKVG